MLTQVNFYSMSRFLLIFAVAALCVPCIHGKGKDSEDICVICQEPLFGFTNEDTIPHQVMTGGKVSCGHKFHKSCIQVNLGHNNTCPLCREVLSVEDIGGFEDMCLNSDGNPCTLSSCPECGNGTHPGKVWWYYGWDWFTCETCEGKGTIMIPEPEADSAQSGSSVQDSEENSDLPSQSDSSSLSRILNWFFSDAGADSAQSESSNQDSDESSGLSSDSNDQDSSSQSDSSSLESASLSSSFGDFGQRLPPQSDPNILADTLNWPPRRNHRNVNPNVIPEGTVGCNKCRGDRFRRHGWKHGWGFRECASCSGQGYFYKTDTKNAKYFRPSTFDLAVHLAELEDRL